jgi:hypothetical protein
MVGSGGKRLSKSEVDTCSTPLTTDQTEWNWPLTHAIPSKVGPKGKKHHFLNKSSSADFTRVSSALSFGTYAPSLGLK